MFDGMTGLRSGPCPTPRAAGRRQNLSPQEDPGRVPWVLSHPTGTTRSEAATGRGIHPPFIPLPHP